MKNIIIPVLFAVISLDAAAQKQEPLLTKHKKNADSISVASGRYYVLDSLHTDSPAVRKNKKLTVYKSADTLKNVKFRTTGVTYKTATGYRVTTDSLYKAKTRLFYRADSLYRKAAAFELLNDTLKRKKSLFTQRALELKRDSFENARHTYRIALIKKREYQLQLKTDSLRLKQYLQQKKTLMLRFTADPLHIKNGYRIKKLYIDMPCTATDTVFIKNNYRKIQVSVSGSSKVSASATIVFKDSIKTSDAALMNKTGVSLSRSGKNIMVTVNGLLPANLPGNDEDRIILQNEMNLKSTVSIMVPANVVVVINTSNAEANVESYVKTFKTEVTNGKLSITGAGDATIKGNYSTITAGNIKNADITMYASAITAISINTMRISSVSSTVKLKECNSMDVAQSTSDAIVLDKAVAITGNKNFGRLAIDHLEGKLLLTGTGSSVAVNNFSKNIPQVAINSKYADVKLPLSALPNYTVYYEGSFNDVNKTGAVTQQLNALGKLSAALTVQKDTLSLNTKKQNTAKTILKANAGNTNGAYSKIDIVCPYCNVVFY